MELARIIARNAPLGIQVTKEAGRKFGIPAVFSCEPLRRPAPDDSAAAGHLGLTCLGPAGGTERNPRDLVGRLRELVDHAGVTDERRDVGRARLRGERRGALPGRGIGSERAQETAHLPQRDARGGGDRLELARGLLADTLALEVLHQFVQFLGGAQLQQPLLRGDQVLQNAHTSCCVWQVQAAKSDH